MNKTIDNVTETVNAIVKNDESLKEFGIGVGVGVLGVLGITKVAPKAKNFGEKLIKKVFKKEDKKVETIIEDVEEVIVVEE